MLVSERTRCRWLRVSFISALLALSAAGTAQTVRPLIVEYQGAARGHVDYVNDSFQPMTVVLEAKGFKVSETGEITYFPLPGSIHLKLSTMSFRMASVTKISRFRVVSAFRIRMRLRSTSS